MKTKPIRLIAALLLAGSAIAPHAATTVLTFEGVGQGLVGNFYNGGAGPDYNIDFLSAAVGVVDIDAGGSGNFGGEPSPDTALLFRTGVPIMNMNDGFANGFSFFYSAVNQPALINVFSGLNGTGALLASVLLPVTPAYGAPDPNGAFSPFVPFSINYVGTAMSVDFTGAVEQVFFDNITFQTEETGNPVPEPTTMIGGLALGALAVRRALRRK